MINALKQYQIKIAIDKLTQSYLQNINNEQINNIIAEIYPQNQNKSQELHQTLKILEQLNSMNPQQILDYRVVEILYDAIKVDKDHKQCFNIIIEQNILGFQQLLNKMQLIIQYILGNFQQYNNAQKMQYGYTWYNKLINIFQFMSLQYFSNLIELVTPAIEMFKVLYSQLNLYNDKSFIELKTNSFQRLVEFIYNNFLFDQDQNNHIQQRILQLIELQDIAIGENLQLYNDMDELQNALFNMTNNEILYDNFYILGMTMSHYLQQNVNNDKYGIAVNILQQINCDIVLSQLSKYFFTHIQIYKQIKKDIYQLDEVHYFNDESQTKNYEKYACLKRYFIQHFSQYQTDLYIHEFNNMFQQFTLLIKRTHLSLYIMKEQLVNLIALSFENDRKYYEKYSHQVFEFITNVIQAQGEYLSYSDNVQEYIYTVQQLFQYFLQQLEYQVDTSIQNQYTCNQIHLNSLSFMSYLTKILQYYNVVINTFDYQSIAYFISTYLSFLSQHVTEIQIQQIMEITLFLHQQQLYQSVQNHFFYSKINIAFYNALINHNVQKFIRFEENKEYYNKCQYIYEQLKDMELLTPDMLSELLYLDNIVADLFAPVSEQTWEEQMAQVMLYNH